MERDKNTKWEKKHITKQQKQKKNEKNEKTPRCTLGSKKFSEKKKQFGTKLRLNTLPKFGVENK